MGSPMRSSTASATASDSTPTRIRTWCPATRRRSRPATRSASSPASTSRAGSACASRTSSSPIRPVPTGSTEPHGTSPWSPDPVHLDAATILLQWSAGGLAFLWVTTRGRLVSLGYGWLLRSVYGVFALGAFFAELRTGHSGTGHVAFLVGAAGVVTGALVALVV